MEFIYNRMVISENLSGGKMEKIKSRIILILLTSLVLTTIGCEGKDLGKEPQDEEETITMMGIKDIEVDRSMAIIEELSSEFYAGRQAGLEGNEDAEDYISKLFKEVGLSSPEELDNYKQEYTQTAAYPVKATEISVVDTTFKMAYQTDFTERLAIEFAYYDLEFTGKMNYIDSIDQLNTNTEILDNSVLLITDEVFYDRRMGTYLRRIREAGILIEALLVPRMTDGNGMVVTRALYGNDEDEFDEKNPVYFQCSFEAFDSLKKYAAEGKEIKISMDYTVKEVEVANIVGIIPGKNEIGEDETIIIGAHLDHVGNNMNGTYNPGALDNASGISVMIELARLMMASSQPEDTIIFVAFNGEEDGLIGSEYFVNNPPVEYDNGLTKMLNLDMVGSSGDIPLEICSYDYGSVSMREDLGELASTLGLDFIEEDSGGSDHVNFSNAEIPAVMLIHFDDRYYHSYMDTVEMAINRERLETVIHLSLMYLNSEVYQ